MSFRKGSTIDVWESCSIVPIFDLEGITERLQHLPRFRSDHLVTVVGQELDDRVLAYIRGILVSMEEWDHVVPSVVVALRLIMSDEWPAWLSESSSSDHDVLEDPFSASQQLKQSWKLVESKVSFHQWKKFAFMILRRMHIVVTDHPLMAYSTEQISHLNPTELGAVVDILQLQTTSRSPLVIQKLVRDFAVNEGSHLLAVLLPHFSSVSLLCYKHSCLPTARLDVKQNGIVNVTALFDIYSSDDVSICYVRDGTVEQRDAMLQYRTDQSCLCSRCIFEFAMVPANTISSIAATFSRMDLVRLGRYFMAQAKFETARILYLQALQQQPCNNTERKSVLVADIWHALGAIELSLGNFLKAQQIWDDALSDLGNSCSSHPGLMLQCDKLRCYGYTKKDKKQIAPFPPSLSFQWDTPTPGCFVTPMLDNDTCEKIVRWAEDLGSWTKHRHYEVPTFDVPVHSIDPLLDWFQNKFMIPLMNPLLAQQFEVVNPQGYFYVHDAFCVRYEAGASSNHLPIHTDESTHSFVLSLNDDFDGGGTYLFDQDITVRPAKGSVLSFRGDQVLHGGEAVTRGVRYILAVFLYYDDDNSGVEPVVKKPKRKTKLNELLKIKKPKADFSFRFDCGST
jgi:tetratricopeptide (TPR) repeat protein